MVMHTDLPVSDAAFAPEPATPAIPVVSAIPLPTEPIHFAGTRNPHQLAPSFWTNLKHRLGRAWLQGHGWQSVGEIPDVSRFIVIASPHTTNWDLAFMLAVAWDVGFEVKWIGKHTLFAGPMGPLMRWLGGLPIDRRKRANQVDQAAAAVRGADKIMLAIAPEGTRSFSPHWKSGFYHIASTANVPILLGFLDYDRKIAGFGPLLQPSGDVDADFGTLRAFYGPLKGKFPQNSGPIGLAPKKST